jgi:hypothetical protein
MSKPTTILLLLLVVQLGFSQHRPAASAETLVIVKDGAKFGYINDSGKVIIRPQFDEALPFKNGTSLVRIGNMYSRIDSIGKRLSNFQFPFDAILWFSLDMGLAIRGSESRREVGFVDSHGNTVIPPRHYDDVGVFRENLAAVKIGNKWGYIDLTGEQVIEPKFRKAGEFSEGLAAVEVTAGKSGFIDQTGAMVIHLPAGATAWSKFSEGFCQIEVRVPSQGGIIDENGKIKEQRFGFIDKGGKVIIAPRFSYVDSFSEGLAGACIGVKKCGFIDRSGKFVVTPRFDFVSQFSEGLASVLVNHKFGYIDKSGNIIIEPQFVYGSQFKNGVVVYDDFAIDKTGKVIWKARVRQLR